MKTLSAPLSIVAVILSLLFTTACKKDKAATPRTLQGIWSDHPGGTGVVRTITFGKDSVYYVIQNRALYIVPPLYKGAYEVRGNKLISRFDAANFGAISVVPYEFSPSATLPGAFEIFARGTVSFEGDRLIIRYTSSDKSQPQPATAIFKRNPTD